MDNQVKIGVFICACGHLLNDYFEMKALADYAGRCPGVVYVDENRFLCSKNGLDWLKTKIVQSGCNRVVVVGGSPYLYEHTFRKLMDEVGLNPYFLGIADIREGCAWVCRERDQLMPRARQIISAAMRRISQAKPVEKVCRETSRRALVIGAGLTGIQLALELRHLGIEPILIEKHEQVSRKNSPFFIPCIEGIDERELFSSKIRELREGAIEFLTSTEIKEVKGSLGDFAVTLDTRGQERVIKVGAVAVSTGAQSQIVQLAKSFPSSRRLVSMTQLRDMFDFEQRTLERMLVTPDKQTKYACFLLGDSESFAKTNTIMALNGAITLREKYKAEVFIASKDVSVSGHGLESLYRTAREKGVVFCRYNEDILQPSISLEKGLIKVKLNDPSLNIEVNDGQEGNIEVGCDLLVLEDEIFPQEGTALLKETLGVSLNQWGFFQEKNIHLRPNFSNKKGIFFAGSCQGEKDLYEIQSDVRTVAMNIYSILAKGTLEAEKRVIINTDKCALCLTCFRTCPHRAIEIGNGSLGQKWGAKIIEEACQGCGICVGECPAKAIEMVTYTDNQIFSELTFEG